MPSPTGLSATTPRTTRPARALPGRSGTLYRGREGMWSWVGHRITGVLLFVFLLVHVLDTSLVLVSPQSYNSVISTYKNPVVGLGEAGLVAAVLFHAFNGIRIMLVDFWSSGPKHHRVMFWIVLGVFVVLFVPFMVRQVGVIFSPISDSVLNGTNHS